MAYSTSNPPVAMMSVPYTEGSSDLTWSLWLYIDGDATATVDTDGYITNAEEIGMKVNDGLILIDTASNIHTYHRVAAINANGSADLSNGTTIGTATDSD